jgi:dienelactone hydrolase
MQALGIRSDLHLYEGQKHGFFNQNRYHQTLHATDRFLRSLGYLEGLPDIPHQEPSDP